MTPKFKSLYLRHFLPELIILLAALSITFLAQTLQISTKFTAQFLSIVYADDILLLAHTVNGMQEMLMICDEFALEFDMKFNNTKSMAIRIGYRYNTQCSPCDDTPICTRYF